MESPQYNSISLLSGEQLLGSWYPAAKPSAHGSTSDGWGEGLLASSPPQPLSPASDIQGSSPFGSEWMDTNVDLLDYLAGSELEGIHHESQLIVEDPTARAVEMLKSIAEDQSVLLDLEVQESTSNLTSPAGQHGLSIHSPTQQPLYDLVSTSPIQQALYNLGSTSPTQVQYELGPASPLHQYELGPASPLQQARAPSPVVQLAAVEATQADLLDIFPEALDETVAGLDPSSILAPMSPEDIDDILSSGPTSPAHIMQDYTLSTSLDAGTDLTTSSPEPATSSISMDLFQLLQQVQAHESSSPPPVVVEPRAPTPPPAAYRSKPYERPRKPGSSKGLPREVIQEERRLRKKQQNKDAATRYRQKKKAEQGNIDEECDVLEARNTQLHEKVDQMTKEINYLKDLLSEVYATKGLKLPTSAS